MSSIVTDLLRELKDGLMTDTTIVCEDGSKFEVHRFILGARSVVFKNMFITNFEEKKTGIVIIEEFGSDVVKEFVKFVYSDQVSEDSTNLVKLLTIGHLYQINLLVDICGDILSTKINNDNVIQLAQLADKFDVDVLADKCRDILAVENLSRDQMETLNPRIVFEILMKSKTNSQNHQPPSSSSDNKKSHFLKFYKSIGDPFINMAGGQLVSIVKSSKAIKLVGVGVLIGEYDGQVELNVKHCSSSVILMTMTGNIKSNSSTTPTVINLLTPMDMEQDTEYSVYVTFETEVIMYKVIGSKINVSVITGTGEEFTVALRQIKGPSMLCLRDA